VIVTDASVIAEILLRTPDASAVEARILRDDETLHAPALLDVEVAQVMRRYVSRGEIPEIHGRHALKLLGRFPIKRYDHGPLLSRIWLLRENLTSYDAAYVALAEGLGATLVTRDAALGRVRHHSAKIEVI